MNDNFPNTQVEEDNSILALIGGQRLEDDDDEERTERGTPNAEHTEADNDSLVVAPSNEPEGVSFTNVVASLISQANRVNMNLKLPFPSYSDIQNMTGKEYEDLQDKLQAISYLQYANTERKKRKIKKEKRNLSKKHKCLGSDTYITLLPYQLM